MHYRVLAPTRADLAGGTLDIWPLYDFLGASRTVNVALDLFAEVEIKADKHKTFELTMWSPNNDKAVFTSIPAKAEIDRLAPGLRFPAWVVTSYFARLPELPAVRMEVKYKTSAPARSGLGGSSTLCVALVRGVARYFNGYAEQGWQTKLLEWVRDAEAAFLHVPTGNQDYLAALYGGLKSYQWDIGGLKVESYSESVFEALSQRCLVLFSGETHDSGASNWEIYKGAVEGRSEILEGLSAIREIANGVHQELESGSLNWPFIGGLLNDEWRVRHELFKVNTPRLDEIVTFLKKEGVTAAKVCGAASGGSLLVLVEPGQRSRITEKCKNAGITVLNTRPHAKGVTIEDIG